MAHHGTTLRLITQDPTFAETLSQEWRSAPLDERLHAILGFAEQLTRTPAVMREQDIERLRDAGLEDRGILDVVQVVAYFNFVNRLADGLGVALE